MARETKVAGSEKISIHDAVSLLEKETNLSNFQIRKIIAGRKSISQQLVTKIVNISSEDEEGIKIKRNRRSGVPFARSRRRSAGKGTIADAKIKVVNFADSHSL